MNKDKQNGGTKARNFIGTLNNPEMGTEEFLRHFHQLSKAEYTTG